MDKSSWISLWKSFATDFLHNGDQRKKQFVKEQSILHFPGAQQVTWQVRKSAESGLLGKYFQLRSQSEQVNHTSLLIFALPCSLV